MKREYMRWSLIFFTFILFATVSAETSHKPPDYKFRYEARYKIKKSKGHYLFTGKVKGQTKYLSEKSTRGTTTFIFESFTRQIKKYEHRFNHRKMSKDMSFSFYPASKDQFFNQDRMISLIFPDSLEIGDSTSVKYETVPNQIEWFPTHTVPNMNWIESWQLAFDHPKDVTIDFEIYFPRDSIRFTISRPNEKETILKFDSIYAAPDSLPFFQHNETEATILVRFHDNHRALNPDSDKSFVSWYHTMFDQSPMLRPEENSDLANSLAAAGSDLEKVSLIHDYIRKNVRYISDISRVHAYVPNPAKKTISTHYGDCKDRAYLARALAASQGIDINIALIHTEKKTFLDGIHISAFNHAINAYDTGDSLIFFDPTNQYASMEHSVASLEGQTALITDPELPTRVKIPCRSKSVDIDINVKASLDSSKTGVATIRLFNEFFIYITEVNRQLSGAKLENVLDRLVTANFSKLGLDKFKIIDSTNNSITIEAVADLSPMIIRSPKRMYLMQNPFTVLSPKDFDRADDNWKLDHFSDIRKTLEITLQVSGYTGLADSVKFGVADQASYFALIDWPEPETISLNYYLVDSYRASEPSQKSDYLTFLKNLYEHKTGMFPVEELTK